MATCIANKTCGRIKTRRDILRFVAALGVGLALLAPAPATAQEDPGASVDRDTGAGPSAELSAPARQALSENVAEFTAALSRWTNQLDFQERAIADGTTTDEQLKAILKTLEDLREAIVVQRSQLLPTLQDIRERLAKLGPAPAEGAPAESAELAAQRQGLEADVADIDGKLKQADILFVRAGQLIEDANETRRERFTESLFRPVPNLYSQVLPAAFESLPGHLAQRTGAVGEWIARAWDKGFFLFVLLFAVPVAAGFGVRRFVRRLAPGGPAEAADASASLQERGTAVLTVSLLNCLPVWAGLTAFYLLATTAGLAEPALDGFLLKALLAAAWAMLLVALIRHTLVPDDAGRKIIPGTAQTSWRLASLLWAMVGVWLCDRVLVFADSVVFTPFPIETLRSCAVALLLGLLLAAVLWTIQRGTIMRKEALSGWRGWMYSFMAVVSGAILLAALLGYEVLARFIAAHAVSTAGLLWIMYLLHLAAESLSSVSVLSGRAIDDDLQDEDDAGAPSLLTIRIIVSLLLDIAILAVGITILLLLWRFDWVEVKGWIQAAFFGFQFGSLRISLQSLLIALGVFALGLLLTRFVQRWITDRVTTGRRSTSGLIDSMRIGIGYLGFVLAALAGISYLGVDFTNLAIIAGALSVGIGFGLQSIFNNFVSGLILLAERPIKIGDYIQVGTEEGTVKKISVRSTEIETIHRHSVIIPNATLITDPVVNWMYLDKSCRLDLPIGVAYGTDMDLLRSTLMGVATSHRGVLRSPPPVVHFAGFGDSSLDFELRVFLRDVRNRITSSSELRFGILAALEEAGISIPFPQRDVHIKDGAPGEAV